MASSPSSMLGGENQANKANNCNWIGVCNEYDSEFRINEQNWRLHYDFIRELIGHPNTTNCWTRAEAVLLAFFEQIMNFGTAEISYVGLGNEDIGERAAEIFDFFPSNRHGGEEDSTCCIKPLYVSKIRSKVCCKIDPIWNKHLDAKYHKHYATMLWNQANNNLREFWKNPEKVAVQDRLRENKRLMDLVEFTAKKIQQFDS